MLKKLRDKLAAIAQEMRDMHSGAETEERGFDGDELTKWNGLLADFESLEARIGVAERIERMEATPAGSAGRSIPNLDGDGDGDGSGDGDGDGEIRTAMQIRGDDEYRSAFINFVQNGRGALVADQRTLLNQNRVAFGEQRALSAGTDSEGGFTIPEGFAGFITETMQDFSGLLGAANPSGNGGPTLLVTSSGNLIPFPTNDDTGNAGVILAENAAVTEQDTVFGARNLIAYMYTSRLIRVSLQLLQDEAVNLEAYLGNILGKRLGRAVSPHFALGTGSGQPTGLVTAATDGGINVSTAAGLTFIDLLDFEHALDPAYRRRGAKWCFNDNTLRGIKGLLDGNNRPLWLPADVASIEQGGARATLLGYGYIVDQGLANVGTGNRPVAFGDLSEFYIRQALGVNLFRFNERYMDNLQIGFMAYARYDSNLVDTDAVVTDIGVA